MIGATFLLRRGLAAFCEHELGMSEEEARRVSKWTALGAAFFLADIPGAIANLAEDVFADAVEYASESELLDQSLEIWNACSEFIGDHAC